MALHSDEKRPAVLITGTSSGIGEACALELFRRGFRVFAGVRKEADGQRLRQRTDDSLVPVILDVTDANTIYDAVKQVEASVGEAGLAGLVNNAGIIVPGPLELLSTEHFRRQLEVNLLGTHAVTRAFLPLLRAARGRIVLIGSISGLITPPYYGAYAASKHGLEALGDALRMELRAWGIAVSIVEPDSVSSPLWDKFRDTANQIEADATADARHLYDKDMHRLRAATSRQAKHSLPAERVVRVVLHALTAKRPKTRYPVGFRTWLAVWAFHNLPNRLFDWLLLRFMGLR